MRGVPVALGPLSFSQVNTEGANRLYGVAADFAAHGPDDTLLDLYCGAGTIGLSMAEHCGRLIGVETVSYTHLDVYKRQVYTARYFHSPAVFTYVKIFCLDGFLS